jgi:3-carboxy-cis,cis-muconate cycloisomerase
MIHEHERDWSSVHMEWAYLPEVCIMTHGALLLTLRVVRGLHVYPDAMARNLDVTGGTLLAERVMLELGKAVGRQKAHDVVHAAAMQAFEQRVPFGDVLKHDPRVNAHLSDEIIDRLLDPATYLGQAGEYVDRVTEGISGKKPLAPA